MHLVGVHLTFTKFKMYMSDLTLTKILDVKQNLGNLAISHFNVLFNLVERFFDLVHDV